jgi:hypothetical protein
MAATFQNSAMVLSIGIFFSLMIVGLSSSLPGAMNGGLLAQGVPAADAARISHLPAVGVLFASFLGYNPMQHLLGPTLHQIPAHNAAYLTGPTFFPHLIAAPFANGLHVAFDFAIVACLIAAAASWLRGSHYVHGTVGGAAARASETEQGLIQNSPLAPEGALALDPSAPPAATGSHAPRRANRGAHTGV